MNFKICATNGKPQYEVTATTQTRTLWIGAANSLEDAKELIKTYALDNRKWITCITMEGE